MRRLPHRIRFGKDFRDLRVKDQSTKQRTFKIIPLEMAFFKAKKQTKYPRLDNSGLRGAKEAETQCISEECTNSRSKPIEAKRPLCRSKSSSDITVTKTKSRGLFRWRSRNSRQIKQRKQHTLLRNRVNENREDSKVDATPVHQDDEVYRGVNRRMATCEQLEKCTLVGDRTLRELRADLIVRIRLIEFGLLKEAGPEISFTHAQ